MRRARPVYAASALLLLLAVPLTASPMSDFQARLAQTQWNLAALEGLVKSQKSSVRAVPTPEAIESFLHLLAENVTALTAFAGVKVTDEQARVITEGIRTTAAQLRDVSGLVSNRGFASAVAEAQRLEASCRLAIADSD